MSLFWSCRGATPDAREDLIRSLAGENVRGFDYGIREDDVEEVASLTNSAVRGLINLDGDDAHEVLKYTRIRNKATNITTTYKTAVVRKAATISLVVTEVGTNNVTRTETFPEPAPKHGDAFDSLDACLKEWDCINRGQLQCEANRTCENQYAAITCCLKNGQCFSVHLVIKPTTLRCRRGDVIPDLEGLVFRQ